MLWRSLNLTKHLSVMAQSKRTVTKISVNGANLAYEKFGSGQNTVMLLPGALGSSRTDFLPQINGLNREKFTIVCWDPRGYGNSVPPKRDFDIKYLHRDADDATQLMLNLGFEKFSLAGWSDGGNTAAIMAARNPDKIDKLVIWGANSFISKKDVEIFQNIRDVSKWSERMRKPMEELYGKEYFIKMWTELMDTCMNKIYHENNGEIYTKELKHITAPTLIIHGRKDYMVPPFHAEYLHENIKGSVLNLWPDGKHNLHLSSADRFNSQLEEFLLKGQKSQL